jgi:hypothetical protein
MNRRTTHVAADVTAAFAQLLPELAVTLYESAPHDHLQATPDVP